MATIYLTRPCGTLTGSVASLTQASGTGDLIALDGDAEWARWVGDGVPLADGAVTDADDTTPTQPEAGADQDRPEGAAEPGEPDGAVDDNAADEAKKPAGNATEDAWREYALANGKSEDDLKGLGRNEIRDLFA